MFLEFNPVFVTMPPWMSSLILNDYVLGVMVLVDCE